MYATFCYSAVQVHHVSSLQTDEFEELSISSLENEKQVFLLSTYHIIASFSGFYNVVPLPCGGYTKKA